MWWLLPCILALSLSFARSRITCGLLRNSRPWRIIIFKFNSIYCWCFKVIEKLCLGSQQSLENDSLWSRHNDGHGGATHVFFCNGYTVGKILSLLSNIKFHLRLFVYQKLVVDAKQMGFCSSTVSQRDIQIRVSNGA